MPATWEFQGYGVHIADNHVAWSMTNTGADESADGHHGDKVGVVSIRRRANPQDGRRDADGQPIPVDETPWQNDLHLDRDVLHGTAHSMTYPLMWDGQEQGRYAVTVTIEGGGESEVYFVREPHHIELDTGG